MNRCLDPMIELLQSQVYPIKYKWRNICSNKGKQLQNFIFYMYCTAWLWSKQYCVRACFLILSFILIFLFLGHVWIWFWIRFFHKIFLIIYHIMFYLMYASFCSVVLYVLTISSHTSSGYYHHILLPILHNQHNIY